VRRRGRAAARVVRALVGRCGDALRREKGKRREREREK